MGVFMMPLLTVVTHHLVGRVVSFQLFVVGVLNEDWVIADYGLDGGVIVHHRLSRLLCVHLQESLSSHNNMQNTSGQSSSSSFYFELSPQCNLSPHPTHTHTWFLPLSISRLVTLPKGSPNEITSASLMSLGNFLTWTTREGTPGLLISPLNFLLSLPFAGNKDTKSHINFMTLTISRFCYLQLYSIQHTVKSSKVKISKMRWTIVETD